MSNSPDGSGMMNEQMNKLIEEKNQLLDYVEESLKEQTETQLTIKAVQEENESLRLEINEGRSTPIDGDYVVERLESEIQTLSTQLKIEKDKNQMNLREFEKKTHEFELSGE